VPFLALATLVAVTTAFSHAAATSPTRIIFASDATDEFGEHIDLVAVDGRGRPKRVGDLGRGVHAAPSPDGHRIAYLHEEPRDDGPQLYVMNRDGTQKRRLTQLYFDLGLTPLLWSPNGRRIIFGRGGPKIGIAAADGSTVRYIRTAHAVSPDWSPDGKSIAYTTQEQTEPLFLARADGSRAAGSALDPHRGGLPMADGSSSFATGSSGSSMPEHTGHAGYGTASSRP